jgi:hypothetical protein
VHATARCVRRAELFFLDGPGDSAIRKRVLNHLSLKADYDNELRGLQSLRAFQHMLEERHPQ